MRRVLITGMSGTGKSTLISELKARGYKAIDTGWDPSWEEPDSNPAAGSGWRWREDRIDELLSTEDAEVLFVSACVPNQWKFYARFDHAILLSAPVQVTIDRLKNRTSNPYGKEPDELEDVLRNKAKIEPLLRKGATVEIDTTAPINEVVTEVIELVMSGAEGRI